MAKAYRHGELTVQGAVAEVAMAAGAPGADVLARDAGLAQTSAAGPFPKLMSRSRMPALPPHAVLRPCSFDADLVIGYVRTLPHGQLPITLPEVAERWPQVDDLHAEALRELEAATTRDGLEGMGWGAELVMGYALGDGHDAARALLGELLEPVRAWLEGNVLVAIPCRDVLMAFGDADAGFVEEARAHIAELVRSDPQPLSARLYRLENGRLVSTDE
jgi:hypothetical protein